MPDRFGRGVETGRGGHPGPGESAFLFETPAPAHSRAPVRHAQALAVPPHGPAVPRGRPGAPVAVLCAVVLAAAAAWQLATARVRLPAAVGEAQLAEGAWAMLRSPGTGLTVAGWADPAAQAHLWAYGSLTGALERHPAALAGARELALVASVMIVAALLALAWHLRTGPVAVAVALALLVVCEPAITSLATFGPGLIGVAWLAAGAALLVRIHPACRVLGVGAAVVGILTAPVLVAPLTVAVVALTVRRWAPVALVAAVAGSAVLVLVWLSPASAMSAVGGSGRLVLLMAGVAVVVAASGLPSLRVAAAATASVALLAALPWPGADMVVPAMVVAVLLVGTAVVDEIACRVSSSPLPVRGLAAGALVIGWMALALAVAPDARPVSAREQPHRALAAWIGSATDPATTITAPPDVRADLIRAGVPAQRLVPGGMLVVSTGPVPPPAVLARFEGVTVAAADPALLTSTSAEASARAAAGVQLAGNRYVAASPEVLALLRSGGVDGRVLVLLAGLAGQGRVSVIDLPAVPGEDPALPRHRMVLAEVSSPMQNWLRAQQPPFAPAVLGTAESTTLTWPVPAPPVLPR